MPFERAASRALVSTVALLACACAWLPAWTQASSRTSGARAVRLTASFTPERLGAGTTVRIGFRVDTAAGRAPSPPIDVQLLLPAGLGIATSDLGLETCTLSVLEHVGLAGCPTDSLMGHGSALAEVPFGSSFVFEQARVLLFSGPLRNGHPELLMFASGEFPVLADLVFPSLVLPTGAPFGGLIDTRLPLVPSVPEGPDVALVALQTTIGPAGITYYETVKGRRVAFHPRGILLPRSCPRGGFPFAVRLTFQDGSGAAASTAVPCPRGRAARHGRPTRPRGTKSSRVQRHRP
jgi:hypothetical protein